MSEKELYFNKSNVTYLTKENIVEYGNLILLRIKDIPNLIKLDIILPPKLEILVIHCTGITLFDNILPSSLQLLFLWNNNIKIFNSILPPNLLKLSISLNKIISFKSILPNSLLELDINSNRIKKLKLNRVVISFYYDTSPRKNYIKNKKTFHKSKFYTLT